MSGFINLQSMGAINGALTPTKSTFDFNSILKAGANGLGSGENVVASLANEGLNLAASAIPFGSTIKGILDKLGLQKQIGLVTKYGLSSWGASNSPEKSKREFAEKVLPFIIKLTEDMKNNPAQLDKSLDALSGLITINIAHHKHRVGKSGAKSSKLGHQLSVKQWTKLRDKLIPQFKTEFGKLGVKITSRPWNVSLSQLPINMYLMHDGRPIDNTYGASFTQYDVDYSGVKVDEETGQISDKSSGGIGKVLGFAGLAFAGFKALT